MKHFINLGKKLFPICRSITGKGVTQTLRIIKNEIPELKIKKIKSGSRVFDWKIPPEWVIDDAYVKYKNKRIIDFKKNNLHLVNYSIPVKKNLNKNSLLKKIFSIKEQPFAIPYVTSYYKKNWGFCITDVQKENIIKKYPENTKFQVRVKSSFKRNGFLTYGELIIPGKSKKEILISTYICHPSMANNELSGPLVSVALAKYYLKRKNKRTIKIIFIPETIGSIAYIKKKIKDLKKNVIGGYVLTCIGDNRSYSYLESKYGNSISDYCAKKTFEELKLKYKNYSFLERGSDERQFNSVGIDLGVGSLMRSKYGEYPEYHTSLDTFGKVVTLKGLKGGYKVAKLAVNKLINLKLNKTIKKKSNKNYPLSKFICEPNLGRRNLYDLISIKNRKKTSSRNLLNFLQYADGKNSLSKIKKYIKLNKTQTKKIFNVLRRNQLLK